MLGVSLSRSDPCGSSPKTQRQLVMGSLRVIELQLVAFIMVFSASGLVPVFDLAFPVFTSGYLLLLSRLVFRPIGSSSSSGQKNEAFNQYLMDQKINYDQMERKKQLHPSPDRQQQEDKNST
ncbi:hypothetical protein R6Q59_006830 [Mikania micrantha]